jgi:hypothetical protein
MKAVTGRRAPGLTATFRTLVPDGKTSVEVLLIAFGVAINRSPKALFSATGPGQLAAANGHAAWLLSGQPIKP